MSAADMQRQKVALEKARLLDEENDAAAVGTDTTAAAAADEPARASPSARLPPSQTNVAVTSVRPVAAASSAAAAAAAAAPPPPAAAAAAADSDEDEDAEYRQYNEEWTSDGDLGPLAGFGDAYCAALKKRVVLAPSGSSFGARGLTMPVLGIGGTALDQVAAIAAATTSVLSLPADILELMHSYNKMDICKSGNRTRAEAIVKKADMMGRIKTWLEDSECLRARPGVSSWG
jgi:hypothetical protein